MNASLVADEGKAGRAAGGVGESRPAVESHRYATPSVREMTRAETDDQRQLVRASLLAKPA